MWHTDGDDNNNNDNDDDDDDDDDNDDEKSRDKLSWVSCERVPGECNIRN